MSTVRLSEITDQLDNVKRNGRDGFMASCPAHDDSDPSLSITVSEDDDGEPTLLLHCFAGCSIDEMTTALGITKANLYRVTVDLDDVKPTTKTAPRTALDLTADELSHLENMVRAATPGPNVDRLMKRVGLVDAWEWRLGQDTDGAVIVPAFDVYGLIRGVRRRYFDSPVKEKSLSGPGWLPYTYRRNTRQDRHAELIVTEGPIDALTAYAAGYDVFGIFGTSNANSPDVKRDLVEVAKDRVVIVVGDNDVAGRRFNSDIQALVPTARVVVPPVGDLNDWYAAGPESFPAEFRAAIDTEDAEDTAALLDDVSAFLRRFLFLGHDEWFDVLALWTLESALTRYTPDADIAPRVGFISGTPGSGKTLALDLLTRLTTGELVTDATPPAVLRLMNGKHLGDDAVVPVPVFLDEIDNLYKSRSTDNGSLTAVLNSGYKRGATVTKADREDQSKVVREECFGPVGFAGLAMSALPEALLTRSFVVTMPKATRDELPETFRPRRHGAEAAALAKRIQDWARLTAIRVGDALDESEDRLADWLGNRDLEIWSAIDAVAVIAGPDWTKRVDAAIPALKDATKEREEQPSLRMLRLASELHEGGDRGAVYAPISDVGVSRDALCEFLNDQEPLFQSYNQGRGINGEQLRKMLSDFDIGAPKPLKLDGRQARGWRWEDFAAAWDRYL